MRKVFISFVLLVTCAVLGLAQTASATSANRSAARKLRGGGC